MLVIHPESHYLCFNNILTLIEDVQKEDDSFHTRMDRIIAETDVRLRKDYSSGRLDSISYSKMCTTLTTVSKRPRFTIYYYLSFWTERDDRIAEFAAQHAGVTGSDSSSTPTEHQFRNRWESGFWRNRVSDTRILNQSDQ